jgi:hypothetical protein
VEESQEQRDGRTLLLADWNGEPPLMSLTGPGCVKTPMRFWKVEFLSRIRRSESRRRPKRSSRVLYRENNSQEPLQKHVFTQVRRETGKE